MSSRFEWARFVVSLGKRCCSWVVSIPFCAGEGVFPAVLVVLVLVVGSLSGGGATIGDWVVQTWGVEEGLPGTNIKQVVQSRDGFLWLNLDGALARFNGERFGLVERLETGEVLRAKSICGDAGGGMWVVTQTGGVARWEGGKWQRFTSEHNVPVGAHGVYPSGGGGVVISDEQGAVYLWEAGRFRRWLEPAPGGGKTFVGINTSRDGTVWVRHEEQLGYWDGQRWKTLNGDGDPRPALKTAARRGGGMWIATEQSVGWFAEGRYSGPVYTVSQPMKAVQAMLEDRDGGLWITTGNDGITRVDGAGRTLRFKEEDGFLSDRVRSFCEDELGNMWIGTDSGLCALRPAGNLSSGGGRLAARKGTVGLIAVIPVVERVVLDGKEWPWENWIRGELWVPRAVRTMELQFDAALPGQPEGLRFRYRKDGEQGAWVDAGAERSVEISNLVSGRHSLQLQAGLEGGAWSPAFRVFTWEVEPPLWRARWFQMTILVGMLGLSLVGFVWRVGRLQRKRKSERLFARQLLDLQEAERQRIAAELHDGLGQQLLVIKNAVQLALQSGSGPAPAQENLKQVSETAGACLEEIRQLARNLRPYQLDQMGLTRAIRSLVEGVSRSSGLPIRADLDDADGVLPKSAEIQVFRMVQEGLSNMVKHSRSASGKVTMVCNDLELTIQIEDDGCGIPADNRRGFGLNSLEQRVGLLNGELKVQTREGQGTQLHIRVPRRNGNKEMEK